MALGQLHFSCAGGPAPRLLLLRLSPPFIVQKTEGTEMGRKEGRVWPVRRREGEGEEKKKRAKWRCSGITNGHGAGEEKRKEGGVKAAGKRRRWIEERGRWSENRGGEERLLSDDPSTRRRHLSILLLADRRPQSMPEGEREMGRTRLRYGFLRTYARAGKPYIRRASIPPPRSLDATFSPLMFSLRTLPCSVRSPCKVKTNSSPSAKTY